MNIKIAFLYDDMKETIYVTQLTNFETKNQKNKICKLIKAFYSLKQSPRVWYNILIAYLKELGFESIAANLSVFTNNTTIIVIYMNDILLTSPDKAEIQRIKNKFYDKFEITNLEPYIYYLGIIVIRDRVNRILRLSQKDYIEKFLKEHNMTSSASSLTLINSDKFYTIEDNFTSID